MNEKDIIRFAVVGSGHIDEPHPIGKTARRRACRFDDQPGLAAPGRPDHGHQSLRREKRLEFGQLTSSTVPISAAGRAMDMSYKRAWDLVDEINRICRQAAVERQTGGKNGGGAVLTPFGRSLVARYRKIERSATSAARKELQALRSDIGRAKKRAG